MQINSKIQTLILVFILALAIFLRFINFNFIEFNDDQAINLILSQEILQHGLPQHCLPSSVDICNSPIFPYILSPFVLISSHPLFITAIIAALNILAILLYVLRLSL